MIFDCLSLILFLRLENRFFVCYAWPMIIDGKKIAEEMLAEVAAEVKKLPKPPRLAAVLAGNAGNGRKFLELKKRVAESIGIDNSIRELPAEITSQKLRKEIVDIARAGVNDAVIIELPLPSQLNTQYILNAVPEDKDVDVLSQKAQGAFFAGRSPILPPAVEAVRTILEKYGINLPGKHCAIFGYGLLVGRPVSHWLARQGATVSIINEHTPNPGQLSSRADIVISGVGKADLITASMVRGGVIVIDFGYENLEGKSAGDVAYEEVSAKASLITPVPGGVGPIVIAAVFKNMLKLIQKQNK